MDSAYAAPAARGIDRGCHCLGGTTRLSNYDVSQHGNVVGTHATANSYAAQQHFEDGRVFQLRDAGGAHFEPQTSYTDHYPRKVTTSPAPSSLTCVQCCLQQAALRTQESPAVLHMADIMPDLQA